MLVAHADYVILERMLIQTVSAMWLVAALRRAGRRRAGRRRTSAPKARRHFISVSFETQFVQPYGFAKHPLEELLGQPVDEVHLEIVPVPHRAIRQTLVNVLEYGKRATGDRRDGLSVRLERRARRSPIRGSIETMPDDPGRASPDRRRRPTYELTNGRATDLGVGIDMSDRVARLGPRRARLHHRAASAGFRPISSTARRYFVEGGGGVTSGPFGVDVSVKFTVNRFTTPVHAQRPHDSRSACAER